jgi:hypothetical protein
VLFPAHACVCAHLDVVEALHKVDNGALSTSTFTNKSRDAPSRHHKSEAIEYRNIWPCRVRKVHVLQLHFSFHFTWWLQALLRA